MYWNKFAVNVECKRILGGEMKKNDLAEKYYKLGIEISKWLLKVAKSKEVLERLESIGY